MILLYIVLAMVLYDLSLHLYELIRSLMTVKTKHPYHVRGLFDKLGRGDPVRRNLAYQIFWSIYWATAAIILVIYFLFH